MKNKTPSYPPVRGRQDTSPLLSPLGEDRLRSPLALPLVKRLLSRHCVNCVTG